ncbi:hypothetical protein KDL01_11125 [Actinospica durhamensis]|uniref:Uncharacterized protein n=1 Tax=Actinospica durhamensis TaxID=1508375 RepID=A0A941EM30_9ACTN|nr:hypothetical protein [Actinospica durhamensis]MBR7833821.1 hypothetical protein [Actinospica durhamensis]
MTDTDSHDAVDPPDDDAAWAEIDPATGQLRCPWCKGTEELDFRFPGDDDRYQKKVALAGAARADPALFEKNQPVEVYCYCCEHECAVPPHCQLAPREQSGSPELDPPA